jgi:hypothetical protein
MPTLRGPVELARIALADARRNLVNKLYLFELERDKLREAKRKTTDLDSAEEDFEQAENAFKDARAEEATRFSELQTAIANWLPYDYENHEAAAAEDIGRLEATAPIVLLPVRLETRFEGSVLKVRVYPDEIFLNTHERALTVAERDAAIAYYTALNEEENETGEMPLWRDMVARFGVQRAAYVLRQMLPVFGDPGPTSSWFASSFTCGGTIYGGQGTDLFFPQDPDIQLRSGKWTRPGEGVLPDRFAFITYQGDQRTVTLGNPIVEPLAMTPDPKAQEADMSQLPDVPHQVDDRTRWSVDFARALSVGMGVEIGGAEAGFDRLIVVGVKSSVSLWEGSRMLEQLMDAHHYTRGLAIVRQGSPTNNSENEPTSYPLRENAGEISYGIERTRAPLDREHAHHCLPPEADGHFLGMALGVPSGVFSNVDRGYEHDVFRGQKMNQVLWPGTLGYFSRQLMLGAVPGAPNPFTKEKIADARAYFEKYVLARGIAPVFRVGETPYGVLPVASLKHWGRRDISVPLSTEEDNATKLELAWLEPLKAMLDIWKEGVGKVPRILAGVDNPDIDMAKVLSTYPSAREIRIRTAVGLPAVWLTNHFIGSGVAGLLLQLAEGCSDIYGLIGHSNWRPRIGMSVFSPQAPLFTGDLVTGTLSEAPPLTPNYVYGIMNANIQALTEGNVDGKPENATLLYEVLRQATLIEYLRAYHDDYLVPPSAWNDPEVFHIPSISAPPPVLEQLYPIPPGYLANPHLGALYELASASSAELERLFTESLDLTSHRLDAWIGAYAARRIAAMRQEQVRTQLKPTGTFIGAYGWLEEVRPNPRTPIPLPDVGNVETQEHNGGFIHTPSMSHGSAAAVLRNAHLSLKADSPATYAIDLSSRRVRNGRRLFEGVRNGQPVGALLGYELERALHDKHAGSGGDQLRFTLRKLYPLVANKGGEDEGVPAEAIAARNVVDGSALLRAHEQNLIPWGTNGLPVVGTILHGILDGELDRLVEMYDATADLLTAESVFQLVRGNLDAAVPTIRNVVDGTQPPDTVISRSARGGTGLSQRVALVFQAGDDGPELPDHWPATTPRATTEPVLNAWLGQLLGDPEKVTATLVYLDEDGEVIQSSHDDGGTTVSLDSVTIRMSELGLHPLDLIALAEVIAQSGKGAVLDRYIVAVGLNDPVRDPDETPTTFKVTYDPGVDGGRSFPEVLEILNAANAVIGDCRALGLRDLLAPDESDTGFEDETSDPDVHERAELFYERATNAAGDLVGARGILQAAIESESGIAAALVGASRYLPHSAFPEPLLDDARLKPQAIAARSELDKRIEAFPAELSGVDDVQYQTLIDTATTLLKAVFGQSYLALPPFDPPAADELGLSLAARNTLLDNEGEDPDKDQAPDRYLTKIMRSRARLGRFRKLNLYARTAGLPRPRVEVVQLPHQPGERWLGLPYDVLTPPEEGRSAVLLLNYAEELNPTIEWTGILLDTWSEAIPNPKETTGVAFHYDSPRSQAPQTILVAAPSAPGEFWSFDELVASLEQTVDLMHIRAVDQEYLALGPALPAAVFATNADVRNTVSTTIQALRQGVDVLGLEDG